MVTLREQAEKLAQRNYNIAMYKDTFKDGRILFLGVNPEFDKIIRPERCQAQGKTMDEVFKNLIIVRTEIIEYLLKNDLPVPYPNNQDGKTVTGNPYYDPANTLYLKWNGSGRKDDGEPKGSFFRLIYPV